MRRPTKTKREWMPDPVYNSVAVSRFINNLMEDGRKSVAQKVFYQAMGIIEKRSGKDPYRVFQEAIKNAAPLMEVWPRRVGGATYLVPREVRSDRRFSLAVKWLIQAARGSKGKPIAQCVAEELLAASGSEGNAVRKKVTLHKQAEANRAFAHFGWWNR